MRLFFSAGEASGDAYAAELAGGLRARVLPRLSDDEVAESFLTLSEFDSLDVVEYAMEYEREGVRIKDAVTLEDLVELWRTHPGVSSLDAPVILGVGQARLKAVGGRLVADSSSWGAMGVAQAVGVAPRALWGYVKATRELNRSVPGLFIPIDFGAFNIPLAKRAKRAGWKVLYFIPPGSWRRNKQGADIPHVCDHVVTPFPWSAEILRSMGANAHCWGHPLKAMVDRAPEYPHRDGLAILPGSRRHEVRANLAVLARALDGLDIPLRFAVASNLDPERMRFDWIKASGTDAEFFVGETHAVLKRSRAAVVCSGTATLEAALCGCPCAVIYAGSWAMRLEYAIRRPKFDYVSLPNILLERPLLREFLGSTFQPSDVRDEVLALMAEGPRRSEVVQAFAELRELVGGREALGRTVDLAMKMLGYEV